MQTIGKYQVEKVLGRGGMGTVYEALDPIIHRKVALKTMIPGLADTPDLKMRFLREAQAAGGLRHRNIVTVYDLGEDRGQPYIAMEFIEGTDLEKIIQSREPHTIEWKLDVLRQVCEGLAYAHRSGIVHRDIKPANIRVTPEGEVKIMDFGIAHLQSSTMTKSGLVLGTVHYMAPEQVEGQKVDHRADIFSVGAIAYELISYRKPFDGESLTAVMFKIMRDRPDPEALPKTDYSPGIENIIMKALAKSVNERYQSLDEMRDDLERVVGDNAPRMPPPRKTPRTPMDSAAVAGAIERERAVRAKALLEAGRRHMAAGEVDRAVECAKQALALSPADEAAKTLIREIESETLKKRVEQEIGEIRTAMQRARKEGQLQKAQVLCKKLLEISPDDPALTGTLAEIENSIHEREVEQLSGMALSYATDGDFDLANKILGRIARVAPQSPKYLELKRYLEEESSRRAAEALTSTAREHLALGNLEEARAAAEEAIAAYPSHGVAREIRERVAGILAARDRAPRKSAPPPGPAATAVQEATSPPAPSPPAAAAAVVQEATPPPTPSPSAPAPREGKAKPSKGAHRAPHGPAAPSSKTTPAPTPPPAGHPAPVPEAAPPASPAPTSLAGTIPPGLMTTPAVTMVFNAQLTPMPEGPPANPEAATLLDNARRLLKERSPGKAVPLLEQAATLDPAHPGIQRILEMARVDARKAEVASLTASALNHFMLNNYAKARKAAEKALALEPENKKAKELMKIMAGLS